jgi:CheY-like chemotaxis protein
LGLSIADLVKLMGGDCIELRSEPGHGSTFSFVLPFEVGHESASDTVDNSEFAGLRVLVVDDSSSSYMQLEETLNEWSADVTVVNRGRVMLERLRSAALRGSPFDLVLIDHSLPDMTAAEMLHALRTDPATASTYVVLMTALTFETDVPTAARSEPDECIPKPVPLELLRRCLQPARTPRVDGVAMASGDLRARDPQSRVAGSTSGRR